jgi:hypothetical protein
LERYNCTHLLFLFHSSQSAEEEEELEVVGQNRHTAGNINHLQQQRLASGQCQFQNNGKT